MEWIQVLTIIGAMGGLFLWNRSESRADNRQMDNRMNILIEAINKEMKDFHGRLCSIEAQRHGLYVNKKESK